MAGLVAGAVLALTPVAVLMFRFNNPDALLTLLMALAAYGTVRAIEKASPRWMALVGLLIGLGFIVVFALLAGPAMVRMLSRFRERFGPISFSSARDSPSQLNYRIPGSIVFSS